MISEQAFGIRIYSDLTQEILHDKDHCFLNLRIFGRGKHSGLSLGKVTPIWQLHPAIDTLCSLKSIYCGKTSPKVLTGFNVCVTFHLGHQAKFMIWLQLVVDCRECNPSTSEQSHFVGDIVELASFDPFVEHIHVEGRWLSSFSSPFRLLQKPSRFQLLS
jgi:hypothetical protein